MCQSCTPVLEALARYRNDDHLSFLPPGHKQGRGVDHRVLDVIGADVFASDVILMNGLDDRSMSGQVLTRAQHLMADAVHADHAYFSTCGSSMSVKACILAVASPGQKLLVSRNAHKSVISGLILSGVDPIWVHPRWDTRWQWAYPPGPEQVANAFTRAPDAAGMLLITPTDYGTCAAIAETARVCHDHGTPLIVDEAWGAHLPFHPDLPSWAMDADADLCVTSVHKMGCGLEQGSVYHLRGDRVDQQRLKKCADLLNTTSPNTLMYAAIDGWRRQMVERGQTQLQEALRLAATVRYRLRTLDGIRIVGRDDVVGPGRADDHDPLKVVIDVSGLTITGYAANDWLRTHHHVDVGGPDHRRITAQITVADSVDTINRLINAIFDLVDHVADLPAAPTVDVPEPGELELEQAIRPREAFFAESERVPARAAVGRISAETISPYPPGVPAVLPGEVINRPVIDYLLSGVHAGMHLPDPEDPELATVRVVAAKN
jgi:arginine decarboxylase